MHLLSLADKNNVPDPERESYTSALEVLQAVMNSSFPTELGLETLLDQIEGAS